MSDDILAFLDQKFGNIGATNKKDKKDKKKVKKEKSGGSSRKNSITGSRRNSILADQIIEKITNSRKNSYVFNENIEENPKIDQIL